MSLFHAIFNSKKTPDPRIAKWRAVEAENEKDQKLAGHWMIGIGDLEAEVARLVPLYARDPENIELGEQILKLGVRVATEKPIRIILAQASVPQFEARMQFRTLEAGMAALDAVTDALTGELLEIKRKDAEHCRKYDLETTELSPLAQKAQDALQKAVDYKQSIKSLRLAHQIAGLVNEILDA